MRGSGGLHSPHCLNFKKGWIQANMDINQSFGRVQRMKGLRCILMEFLLSFQSSPCSLMKLESWTPFANSLLLFLSYCFLQIKGSFWGSFKALKLLSSLIETDSYYVVWTAISSSSKAFMGSFRACKWLCSPSLLGSGEKERVRLASVKLKVYSEIITRITTYIALVFHAFQEGILKAKADRSFGLILLSSLRRRFFFFENTMKINDWGKTTPSEVEENIMNNSANQISSLK